MSRPIQLSITSPVTVEQIFSAFASRDYWLARLAAFGGGNTLDALVVDTDGTVRVGTVQDLSHDALPRVIAKVLPGDAMIVRGETWKPLDDGRVSGTISMSADGMPGSGWGTAVLRPAGDGARLTVSATVEFNVPVVGGTIERLIAGQVAEGICQIQQFTTQWITQRFPALNRHGSRR
jgi:hypothetical protein